MNMSQELKENWLPKLQVRYARRDREGKSRMLDELCEDYEYERKYAIKMLGGTLPIPSGGSCPGPEPQYGGIEPFVRRMWVAAGQPCGNGLRPCLGQGVPYYARGFGSRRPGRRQLLRRESTVA